MADINYRNKCRNSLWTHIFRLPSCCYSQHVLFRALGSGQCTPPDTQDSFRRAGAHRLAWQVSDSIRLPAEPPGGRQAEPPGGPPARQTSLTPGKRMLSQQPRDGFFLHKTKMLRENKALSTQWSTLRTLFP